VSRAKQHLKSFILNRFGTFLLNNHGMLSLKRKKSGIDIAKDDVVHLRFY
jgi:hypothetical protein